MQEVVLKLWRLKLPPNAVSCPGWAGHRWGLLSVSVGLSVLMLSSHTNWGEQQNSKGTIKLCEHSSAAADWEEAHGSRGRVLPSHKSSEEGQELFWLSSYFLWLGWSPLLSFGNYVFWEEKRLFSHKLLYLELSVYLILNIFLWKYLHVTFVLLVVWEISIYFSTFYLRFWYLNVKFYAGNVSIL